MRVSVEVFGCRGARDVDAPSPLAECDPRDRWIGIVDAPATSSPSLCLLPKISMLLVIHSHTPQPLCDILSHHTCRSGGTWTWQASFRCSRSARLLPIWIKGLKSSPKISDARIISSFVHLTEASNIEVPWYRCLYEPQAVACPFIFQRRARILRASFAYLDNTTAGDSLSDVSQQPPKLVCTDGKVFS